MARLGAGPWVAHANWLHQAGETRVSARKRRGRGDGAVCRGSCQDLPGGLWCHDPERARGCRRCWAEGFRGTAHRAGVVRWMVSGAARGGRSPRRHAPAVGGSGVFRGRTRQPGLRSLRSAACPTRVHRTVHFPKTGNAAVCSPWAFTRVTRSGRP